MKNEIQKKESANIQENKGLTPEQVRKRLLSICIPNDDPEHILEELSRLYNKSAQEKGKAKEKTLAELNKFSGQVASMLNLEKHYLLVNTVSEYYRPYVIDFTRQIIQELDCKTATEKALAQVIAGAHVRILEYSKALNNLLNVKFADHEQTGHYALLSKCLDRAQRDFINALTTLKQIKSPSFNINIRTDQALVAQNQQVNINQGEVPKNEKVIS